MIALVSQHGIPVLVAVVVLATVGLIGGLMTEVGEWYENLRFPSIRPPNWLFGPAWTTIYVLIAISSVMAWEGASATLRGPLLALFALNAVLNALWSPLFFKFRRPDWAFAEIVPFWLSIAAMEAVFYEIRPLAALILSPYLLWVTFASWLNWRIVELNRPFNGRPGARRS